MNNNNTQNNSPLVSVIMTAYNATQYIDEAILSLLQQTYTHMEIIIVDDKSTDRTWEKIQSYALKDSRIKVFQMVKNSGPSTASNFALTKATGKYIARLDADDVALPTRIEKQVNFLEQNADVVMLGGQCQIINEQGKIIGEKKFPLTHQEIYNALFTINPIQHPSCMFRLDIFKKAKIRYEKKYFICHDLKILFKLLNYGTFANLPDTILQYRYRPNSITHKDPKRTFKETLDIRAWALKRSMYTPTAMGFFIHMVESALVFLLPNVWINALFQLWRVQGVKKVVTFTHNSFQSAYRFATFIFTTILYLFLARDHR